VLFLSISALSAYLNPGPSSRRGSQNLTSWLGP